MIIESIVPRRHWLNSNTGQTISLFGALPYGEGWNIVDTGFYSFAMSNGTYTNFCRPKLTMVEAMTIWESEKKRIPQAYGIA